MDRAAALILLTAAYPLGRALATHRRTPLVHALLWAAVAWLAWLALAWVEEGEAVRYAALCLTGCAGVAVLGARRPGVGAWNLVVAGLLVVLLLPLAEGFGRLSLSGPRLVFLGGLLAVCALNYLPTRLWPAALLLAAGCGLELGSLTAGRWAVAAAPWAALLALRCRKPASSEMDRTWLRFRDSFGALWAERTREQFNRAAVNAGLAGRLGWNGIRGTTAAEQEQLLGILQALLKRFGLTD